MNLLGLTFASPLILFGLLALPVIWWLLRLTPPRPKEEVFPPTRILEQIERKEETPAQSPWWLTLLRLLMAALIILALADPVKNAIEKSLGGDGPVMVVLDDGWTGGLNWDERKASAESLIREAGDASRPVILALTSDGAKTDLTAKRGDEALAAFQSFFGKLKRGPFGSTHKFQHDICIGCCQRRHIVDPPVG